MPISTRIPRHLAAVLSERARQYPVVTVTGPRQAGKTTLCRDAFPNLPYANLEQPDVREFALADPGGFLARYPRGAVIDEVQRVPSLLSWIQVRVDAMPGNGQFILTGSHQFDLMASITQSLAGRTALLKLLPLSVNELRQAGLDGTTDHLLFAGGYPRIHAQGLPPAVVLGDYFETYVERDLRQLIEVRQLREFRRFVQLCAGRVGCLLNLASLANDVGVSGHTARAWLSLLEASYVVYLLPPWFENIGKRLIKSPKLYFYDVGLAAWLTGVRDSAQLVAHPPRGFLFENLVVMEFVKQFEHHGQRVPLCFYRDSQGVEVDLVVQDTGVPGGLGLVEIKSSQTYHSGFAGGLKQAGALLGSRVQRKMVVYGGDQNYVREGIEVVGLQSGDFRS
ncbi:ATP-binding protein [Rhodoferax sp.]|uniref:ATP-binding protein n=1 Tax=Rhodoferax sp. TaxID=50421 RepID=UPI00274DCD8E|nr:ATP-binding protein [Rhodoferax sp.]